jgi:glycosyltransferase involved in cell wall biosynthesis
MCAVIDAKKDIVYSIVVPFHNEEDAVCELLSGLGKVMRSLGEPYEILAVNDGSTDETYKNIEKIRLTETSIVTVNFNSRRGQTACLAEGFRRVRGHVIISMDGDLQDDPSEIPSMLEAFKTSGAGTVCGWRKLRRGPAPILFLSLIGNFFQSLFLGVPVHDISCTFRIYKKDALEKIILKEEGEHRFIPYLIKREGFSIAEKRINNRPRKYGISKYSAGKAFGTIKTFFKILRRKI